MFNRILIPTDGSKPARRAAEVGIDLAAEHGATVHTLYVVEPIHSDEAGFGQIRESLQETGEEFVSEFATEAEEKGLSVTTAVRDGVPHRVILEYAESNDIDLIVMGTQGRTGIDRYLLGSVTEKVVRLADVPVLTVQPPETEGDE